MAHNSLIKGSVSAWATGTVPSAADFAALDAAQFKSINGDEGGAWAPSSTITIGGAGLTLSGARLTVTNGTFTATGTVTLGGASGISIGGPITSYSPITVDGATITATDGVIANTLDVGGAATFTGNMAVGNAASDTLTVASNSTFNSTVTCNGDVAIGNSGSDTLTVTSAATFSSTVAVSGTLTANGRIKAASSGRYSHNLASDTLAGDVSFSVDGGSRTYMGYTALLFTSLGGANRDIRLYTDGAVAGDTVEIKNATSGGAFTLTVRNAAGGVVTVINQDDKYTYMFDGVDWIQWGL